MSKFIRYKILKNSKLFIREIHTTITASSSDTKISKNISCSLEKFIHNDSKIRLQNIKNTSSLCARLKPEFTTVAEDMKKLAAIIPPNQYYRFHDHWKTVMQKLSFLTAFIKYLEKEELNTREEAAKMVGVYTNREEGFHMDLDDYLHGLLQLASELSRLAVNSVNRRRLWAAITNS
ncbi:Translin [Mytilus coruscus]|uniref:Translin n=1 Tax=Mytilus coruscus TaxID=42192 RepID=A0A6J8DBX3_MYTCO|nr:Translin [Mytilus coruscus]